MTTPQHLDYLVGLIITEWKKTMVKRHNASDDAAHWDIFNELSFPIDDEDSVIKFRIDMIPEAIPRKVEALHQMQRIGLPHLPALVKLAKQELAKSPFAMDSDESSDGKETTFTGLVRPHPHPPFTDRPVCYRLTSVLFPLAHRACKVPAI